MTRRTLVVAFALLVAAAAGASAQMPDPRRMSGIPMPSGDVPPGTIVVRVIRTELGNNIVNQPVELHVGDQVLKATTDQEGRATFPGVAPGADAHAVTVVDGERLETDHMTVGPEGGIRVMLVAGVGAGSGAAAAGSAAPPAAGAPAVEGDVTLGGQSRIQMEFDDDQIEVFYLFDIVNRGAAPVTPKQELVFELPADAEAPAMLEGSSTLAQLRGHRVSIGGPFPTGTTSVQVAYGLPGGFSERVLRQALPATWEQVQVIVSKIGNVQMASDRFSSNTTMPNEGRSFLLGTGPALSAGSEFAVTLTGLPSRSHLGRWLALGLAVIVLLAGGWAAFGGRRASASEARLVQVETRRQKLMADLVRLEAQRTGGQAADARYAARRQDLVAQLERVYGELDQYGGPAGSGE